MRVLVTYGLFEPTAAHIQNLRRFAGDVVVATSESEAIEAAAEAEVMLGHRFLRQCLPFSPQLRWVQSTAGGVDRLPLAGLRERQVQLTRTTHTAPTIARHAVTMAWAVQRRLPEAVRQQVKQIAAPAFNWSPEPRTALIFGTGHIGRAIAQLLRREGMRVIGVKRTMTAEVFAEFDQWVTLSEAAAILRQADWCFLALPRSRETDGWMNERTLRLLPPHATLVNVGRGETIVFEDLCRVLTEGHLGGAALDVLAANCGGEDLQSQTPRLLLTPHVAAHSFERQSAAERFSEEQVARYRRGEPLLNLVDLSAARDVP